MLRIGLHVVAEDMDSSEEEKEEESEDEAEWMKRLIAGKLSKGDKLGVVDHAAINYPPFRWVGLLSVGGRQGLKE